MFSRFIEKDQLHEMRLSEWCLFLLLQAPNPNVPNGQVLLLACELDTKADVKKTSQSPFSSIKDGATKGCQLCSYILYFVSYLLKIIFLPNYKDTFEFETS